MESSTVFVRFSVDKLNQLEERIQTCLDRLTPEQLWMRGSEAENAIGNLVLHLCGNVRQWILTGVAGQADVRQRDSEFAARGGSDAADLKQRLHSTIAEATQAIAQLAPADLLRTTTVQKYDVTVLEAVYHVVEHFSMHTGQILFATKLFTGDDLGFYRHLSNPTHGQTTP